MADFGDKRAKDAQLRAQINEKLVKSGERERLKNELRKRLIECGWRDQLKAHCKDVVREKGLENVKVIDCLSETSISPPPSFYPSSKSASVSEVHVE